MKLQLLAGGNFAVASNINRPFATAHAVLHTDSDLLRRIVSRRSWNSAARCIHGNKVDRNCVGSSNFYMAHAAGVRYLLDSLDRNLVFQLPLTPQHETERRCIAWQAFERSGSIHRHCSC
jgi:hypothetical protein